MPSSRPRRRRYNILGGGSARTDEFRVRPGRHLSPSRGHYRGGSVPLCCRVPLHCRVPSTFTLTHIARKEMLNWTRRFFFPISYSGKIDGLGSQSFPYPSPCQNLLSSVAGELQIKSKLVRHIILHGISVSLAVLRQQALCT